MNTKKILFEAYCDYKKECKLPKFCINGAYTPGKHCFKNECEFFSYSKLSNEMAYISKNSLVKSEKYSCGFGGDMYPQKSNDEINQVLIKKWEEICTKKIEEAYTEYLRFKDTHL